MSDRYVPNTITIPIKDEKGNPASCNAHSLIGHVITVDQRFNTTGAGIRASSRIENILLEDKAANAPFYRLKDDDWKLLVEALEKPLPASGFPAFPVQPARRLLPMIDAIAAAGENEPVSNGTADTASPLPS